jgi:glutamyl-tRNA synthetase
MASTLTLSSKLTPFPYGAVAIATYTQRAVLVFDETATGISLDLNGSNANTEPEIIQTLAKAGGLSDDSSKVKKQISK